MNGTSPSVVDSPYAWFRLAAALALGTLGGVGFWSMVVALPAVQAEFGVARSGASLPYALTMIGFASGGVLMGRLADRFGIMVPVVGGIIMISLGYIAAAYAPNIWVFSAIYGVMIGALGSSATFAPVVADTSLWFARRRGVAIALAASGNYLAGVVWTPILEPFIASAGWRATHIGIGVACLVIMLPLTLVLRRPSPMKSGSVSASDVSHRPPAHPGVVQGLLVVAGVSCCVAMSMPQVHIVAYCVDLGYGPARGAQMLSLMLACGMASRLAFGWVLDRLGGLTTLLVGSTLQAIALTLYLPFNGLVSLYVVSAVFGLAQGGVVPSYAYIIRELFPAREAGVRVSLTLSATLAGMALGGWLSGAIFDATGSYRAALMNGVGWNLLNMAIIGWLLLRSRGRTAEALAAE